MSPTVFRWKGYRFYFFSREEKRMHVHVYCESGEGKFWIVPDVTLAKNFRLSTDQVVEVQRIIKERKDEIIDAWNIHFGS